MIDQRVPVPQLELKNITKSFVKGRPVLQDVNLAISPGEIHALAGANGSGKSTIVKILAGYHSPDGGSIAVAGRDLALPVDPETARRAGLRFVHQENGFVAGMNVLDNMCLGRGYPSGFGWKIRWKEEIAALREALRSHNVVVDLGADASTLSVATRAKLAIIRALQVRAGEERRVVILDEPTAAMGREEARGLGRWLRELADRESLGVLFIGHRPQELREIADVISVLRNGEIVSYFRAAEVTNEEIAEAIVGTRIGAFYPARAESGSRSPVMEVHGVRGRSVDGVSFFLSAGEILGVTGLQGSGFEELPYLLFDGKERRASGRMMLDGAEVPLDSSTATEQLARKVALVPADRVRNAVITGLSIRENVTQPRLAHFVRFGLLRQRREMRDAHAVMEAFRVTPAGTETRVAWLSGGNQQKTVLGKWLATLPRVLILHEPTEGIDVISKREIFSILADRAREGAAVLIASIEYEDLANVCDRILVFGQGKIHAELAGGQLTGEDVMRAAYAASLAGPEGRGQETRWSD